MTESHCNTPTAGAPRDGVPRLGLRPCDAARALGIGQRKLWQLTADTTSGIPHVRFGKAIVYPVHELREWLARQVERGA